MKLYRSLGRIWTGTASDAKAAQGGKDFEQIEVPTDKPGLMAWLNTFDVRPGDRVLEMSATPEGMTDELDEMLGVTEPVTILSATHGPGSHNAATACPACLRTARVAGMLADAEASICAKGDLSEVTDIESLDSIIAVAQLRRASLVAATVDPDEEMLG